eukprot:365010-Chlamydomonas_euryale.AAC.5
MSVVACTAHARPLAVVRARLRSQRGRAASLDFAVPARRGQGRPGCDAGGRRRRAGHKAAVQEVRLGPQR